MLPRGIKFTHAALLTISAVVSFIFLWERDEETVFGAPALVFVPQSDHTTVQGQIVLHVQEFATRHTVTVARWVPDFSESERIRHLYLAVGDPQSNEARWLTEGYPAFSGQIITRMHTITEAASLDPRGFYYVFGPESAAEKLLARLETLGLHGWVRQPFSPGALVDRFRSTPLPEVVLVAAIAAVAMIGVSLLLNARAYGVQRLHGLSFIRILVRDLQALAQFWLGFVCVVTVVTLTFLTWYNGLAWVGLYAKVTGIFAAAFMVIAVTAHGLALALAFGRRLPKALKGELPIKAAAVCAYLIRLPVLLMMLGVAVTVVNSSQDMLTRQDNKAAFQAAGAATFIQLKGILGDNDQAEMFNRVGQWLREADRDGELLLAARVGMRDYDDNGVPDHELVFVNETFLAAQAVVDPAGRRYLGRASRGTSSNTVRVIIPDSLAARSGAITEDALNDVTAGHTERLTTAGITWETGLSREGQSVFGYGAAPAVVGKTQDNAMIRNPVLVILPNGSEALPSDQYAAFATQKQVIFPDPDTVKAGITKHGLQIYVSAALAIRDSADVERWSVLTSLRLNLITFGLAVVVLAVTGMGVCMIYVRRNAQGIFVRHISGWRFVAVHRMLLVAEGVLAALLAIWVPYRVWQDNRNFEEMAAARIPLPYPPTGLTFGDVGVSLAMAALTVGVALLALTYFHRQIVRDGASAT